MLTQEAVLEAVKHNRVGYVRVVCSTIDSRDYSRLVNFFPGTEIGHFGYSLKDGVDPNEWTQSEWSEKNILEALSSDLEFAFEKAHNERGISSSLMFEVIQMWLWILEDPLAQSTDYAPYGLPLYRKVAEKYHFTQKESSEL